MDQHTFLTRLVRAERGCLEWTGCRLSSGYGQVTFEGQRWRVHRLAWTFSFGSIPDGLHVLHHCDNPPCCEPSHLFLGTDADNAADRNAKGRTATGTRTNSWNARKTHCARGHEFTEANTRDRPG